MQPPLPLPKFVLPPLPRQVEPAVPHANNALINQYRILTDFTPLPQPFDYFYSLNSYYWRTVTIVCLRLGERLGRTTVLHSILSTVFYPYILAIVTYLLLPLHLLFIHTKHDKSILPMADRRLIIMFYSFLMGFFSSHLLIEWIPNQNQPHPFFIPAIVGVMIQLVGPSVCHDRKLFLLSTIGVASVLALSIAIINCKFGLLYLLALSFSVLVATFNLQCLIDGMRKGELDMEGAIIKAIIIILFASSLDKVLWGRFEPDLTKHYNVSTTKLILNTVVF